MIERFVDQRGLLRRRAPQPVAGAGALADREIEVFQHGEAAKQLVDLESAGDAATRARGLRQRA